MKNTYYVVVERIHPETYRTLSRDSRKDSISSSMQGARRHLERIAKEFEEESNVYCYIEDLESSFEAIDREEG